MGGVVADQRQRLVVLPGDDADMGILLDWAEQVPFLAIDLQDQRRFGQAGPDGGGDLAAGDAAREGQRLAIGQGFQFGSAASLELQIPLYSL